MIKKGEAHHKSKLTDEDVYNMRLLHLEGRRLRKQLAQLTLRAIASKFDVTFQTADAAIKGKSWAHVPFPPEEE